MLSLDQFDYFAAESTSIFQFGTYSLQFHWRMNILEEIEAFGFKYSKETSSIKDELLSEIDSCQSSVQPKSVDSILRFIMSSARLPLEVKHIAKLALDEYFNYDVKTFNSQLICRCFGIGPQQLIADLQKGETGDVEQWKNKFLITLGCGTCGADVEKFFRESMDDPSFQDGESEAFQKLRCSKFIPNANGTNEDEKAERTFVKPLGKTPFELMKYLKSLPEMNGIQVIETNGYQIKIDVDDKNKKNELSRLIKEKYQLKLEFIS